MFKDGAFNNLKGGRLTRTVRTTEGIQEKATFAAEAKLGGQLRQTRRELQKSCKELEEVETLGNERVQRQILEARKAEKYQSAGHKRELDLMRDENKHGMQTLREDVEDKERQTRK